MPNQTLELKLNPNRLAAIIDSAAIATTEVVNFHFNSLSNADLSSPSESVELLRMDGPKLTADQRRAVHERWILAKAFQELLRAVRHAFEEAHVYITLLTKTHKISSNSTLSEFLAPFQRKAAGMRFPDLLAAVNELLNPKLAFAESYRTLQLARNCLEHRNGIISKIETHGADNFVLSVPRIKLFYVRDGEEVELKKGHKVEPGDDRTHVETFMKLEVRQRSITLGERLTFTLAEFNDIVFACHFLGKELASKLPKPTGG
jgi:hypothetical protein